MNADAMTFDSGTWWLAVTILGFLTGGLIYLVKRSVFGRVDKIEKTVEDVKESCVKRSEHDQAIKGCTDDIKQIRQDYTPRDVHTKDLDECRADIKQIRQDYTPRDVHTKELDECRVDIKKIKEDYITKEDFFREQGKTDRKLDKIMDILLEMKGDKRNE